jgi:hypothetical protein
VRANLLIQQDIRHPPREKKIFPTRGTRAQKEENFITDTERFASILKSIICPASCNEIEEEKIISFNILSSLLCCFLLLVAVIRKFFYFIKANGEEQAQ